MKRISISFLLLCIISNASAQKSSDSSLFNFGFEKVTNGILAKWGCSGKDNYIISVDSLIRKKGNYSAVIEFRGCDAGYKALSFTIPYKYEGDKITLTGFIKTENVTDGYAGLWLRIDPNLAFDNMNDRGIRGTNEWKKYSFTLDLNSNGVFALFKTKTPLL